MHKVNKIIIFLTSIVMFISLIIYINIDDDNVNNSNILNKIFGNSMEMHASNNDSLIQITDTELLDKVKNKEDFILYVYGENCEYCKTFLPKFTNVLNREGFKSLKIPSDKNSAYLDTITNLLGEKFQGTPAVYLYKSGKVIDYFIGDYDENTIKDYLYKFITK